MYFSSTPELIRGEFGEQLNSNVRGFEGTVLLIHKMDREDKINSRKVFLVFIFV